jgi:dynein heavy chain, axonemal
MAQSSPLIYGVVKSFKKNHEIWQKVMQSSHPYQEQFPRVAIDRYTHVLGGFSKLSIIKALVPGKFIQSVRQFVVEEQGEAFLNPPLFNIERSYQDSSPATPLIFILPGADPL